MHSQQMTVWVWAMKTHHQVMNEESGKRFKLCLQGLWIPDPQSVWFAFCLINLKLMTHAACDSCSWCFMMIHGSWNDSCHDSQLSDSWRCAAYFKIIFANKIYRLRSKSKTKSKVWTVWMFASPLASKTNTHRSFADLWPWHYQNIINSQSMSLWLYALWPICCCGHAG